MHETSDAADYLKYAAAALKQRIDWTTDAIGGALCEGDHETPLDALHGISRDITAITTQFGDPDRYSDGRQVTTVREIEPGLITEHIWHPDPTTEEPRSWRGHLMFDPDESCPGVYQIETDPTTQQVRVQVVRPL